MSVDVLIFSFLFIKNSSPLSVWNLMDKKFYICVAKMFLSLSFKCLCVSHCSKRIKWQSSIPEVIIKVKNITKKFLGIFFIPSLNDLCLLWDLAIVRNVLFSKFSPWKRIMQITSTKRDYMFFFWFWKLLVVLKWFRESFKYYVT